MKIKEKEIQRVIIGYLRWRNVFCWKVNNVGIKKPNGSYIPVGLKGVSDIIGILPNSGGQFLAIEVKTKYGKLSPSQEEFLCNINNNGGVGFVARKLEDVEKILKNYL